MFSSLWSTIQFHRYLLVFRAFLNAPYSHICHNYNAKHKIIVLTLAWGRLRCPRRSGQETCYPFHLVLKIFVFGTKWQLTTSRGSLAKRSTSFRLEYIPRASALGKSILWVALIWFEQMPPSSLHIIHRAPWVKLPQYQNTFPLFLVIFLLQTTLHSLFIIFATMIMMIVNTLRAFLARDPFREEKRILCLSRLTPPCRRHSPSPGCWRWRWWWWCRWWRWWGGSNHPRFIAWLWLPPVLWVPWDTFFRFSNITL